MADNVAVAIKSNSPLLKGRSPTLLKLVLLNAIVCGLELCASAGFTYIPPMLLKAGISEEHMSIIIGMGPLFGLFLVPIIGRASDQCRSRWGRRRPFIFWLGIGLLVSLVLIPYGEIYAVSFFKTNPSGKNFGLYILTFGVILLDFTSQACLTPCEALLSDTSRGTDVSDRAFMVYSFMVSIGGCIGYLITALDWTNSPLGPYFGGQEQSAFSVLMVLFVVMMCATLFVADEQPLASLPPDRPTVTVDSPSANDPLVAVNSAFDMGYESLSGHSDDSPDRSPTRALLPPPNRPLTAVPGKMIQVDCVGKVVQCKVTVRSRLGAKLRAVVRNVCRRLYRRLPRTLQVLLEVPAVLGRLAITDFFCWAAVMCFNLFFTDFVGQAVYHGNPNAEDGSLAARRYDEGVRVGSWGLLFHCVTSAAFASVMDRFINRYGPKRIYLVSMMTFTFAMAIMVFYKDIYIVNIMASITGIAFAAITTIPFTLVTVYQESKDVSMIASILQNPRKINSRNYIWNSKRIEKRLITNAL